MHHNFRRLKDSTLAEPVRRRAHGGRTEMKVAGNPVVRGWQRRAEIIAG